MFPDVSYSDILEDLQHTHSLEVTIDNILEQRLVNPPPMFTSHDGPRYAKLWKKLWYHEPYLTEKSDWDQGLLPF